MSLETIRVTQISLVSARNYVICELLTGNEKCSPITKGQSRVFCLKSVYNDSGLPNEDQNIPNEVAYKQEPLYNLMRIY